MDFVAPFAYTHVIKCKNQPLWGFFINDHTKGPMEFSKHVKGEVWGLGDSHENQGNKMCMGHRKKVRMPSTTEFHKETYRFLPLRQVLFLWAPYFT